jgi:hypothetical protein
MMRSFYFDAIRPIRHGLSDEFDCNNMVKKPYPNSRPLEYCVKGGNSGFTTIFLTTPLDRDSRGNLLIEGQREK